MKDHEVIATKAQILSQACNAIDYNVFSEYNKTELESYESRIENDDELGGYEREDYETLLIRKELVKEIQAQIMKLLK